MTFDTFAWVEYFLGTEKGRKVKKVVDSAETIFTPSLCLLELKAKYLRERAEYQTKVQFMKERSQTVPLTDELALLAADMKIRKGLHASDAIIYATAMSKRTKLFTGDPHFFRLEDVELL